MALAFVVWLVVLVVAVLGVLMAGRALGTIVSIHRRRRLLSNGNRPHEALLSPGDKASILVVLGSGGHTAEMLTLVEDLLPHIRAGGSIVYVAGASDHHSVSKAQKLHSAGKDGPNAAEVDVTYELLPRAREVGQSWISSIGTSTQTCAAAARLLWRKRPHTILCNGPGTCAVVGAVAFALRLGWPSRFENRVIYVESFARVETLSLSGKIMYVFADRFLVQWQQLGSNWPRCEYYGRLC